MAAAPFSFVASVEYSAIELECCRGLYKDANTCMEINIIAMNKGIVNCMRNECGEPDCRGFVFIKRNTPRDSTFHAHVVVVRENATRLSILLALIRKYLYVEVLKMFRNRSTTACQELRMGRTTCATVTMFVHTPGEHGGL